MWEFIIWRVCVIVMFFSFELNYFFDNLSSLGYGFWNLLFSRVFLMIRKEGVVFCFGNLVRWVMELFGLIISFSEYFRIKDRTFKEIVRFRV